MPVTPVTATASSSTPALTLTSNASKSEGPSPSQVTPQVIQSASSQGVKQIAICVTPSPAVSSSAASRSTGNVVTVTQGSTLVSTGGGSIAGTTTTYFPNTSGQTTATAVATNQIQNLGLMVTRFPNDSRQFVFQPATRGTGTGTAMIRPGVVVTTSNAASVASNSRIMHVANIAPHQTLRTIVQGNTGNSTAGNNIQVMNLSVTNPAATSSVTPANQVTIKQTVGGAGGRPAFNTFPIETVNMIVSNDPNTSRIVNVKPGVVPAQNVKISRTSGGISSSGQQTKVISLTTGNPVAVGTSGSQGVATQQVTRLAMIQHQGTSVSGKTGIINIAMPKNQAVIINPSNHHPHGAASLTPTGTVVGSFTTTSHQGLSHHQTASGQHHSKGTTMIPVNPAVMTIGQGIHAGRHTLIPAGTAISTAQFPGNQQRIITANTMNIGQHQQQAHFHSGQVVSLTAATASPSSPMKTTGTLIATSAHNLSPVKQAQQQQQQASTPSSPRPSILSRKRTVVGGEGTPTSGVVRNLHASTKNYQEIKSAAERPQHLIIDSPTPGHEASSSQETTGSTTTTPRKKPRKQLLEPFNLSTSSGMKILSASDATPIHSNAADLSRSMIIRQDSEDVLTDDASQEEEEDYEIADDQIPSPQTMAATRKPRLSLLSSYGLPWKSLQYHFLRYTDVKPKAEKKLTLSELSNEGLQKKNGWKIHHLATQMEDMAESEGEIYDRLNCILSKFEDKVSPLPSMDDPLNPDLPVKVSLSDKLTDLIRGNLQRSNVFQEQINESRSLLIKLTNDHREKIGRVTRKNINKRTCISK